MTKAHASGDPTRPSPAPQAERQRWGGLVWLLAGLFSLLITTGAGCVDSSHIFSGRWESEDAPLQGLLHGVPVLALGHYEREVAGVAYFMANSATGTLYDPACPCAFVEYNALDVDEGTLAFETQCDAASPLLLWALTRVEDAPSGDVFLEGTVSRSDGQPGPVIEVRLRRVETTVTDGERQCPPAP